MIVFVMRVSLKLLSYEHLLNWSHTVMALICYVHVIIRRVKSYGILTIFSATYIKFEESTPTFNLYLE